MRGKTRFWLSLLPLLACVLAVGTPTPALRGQSQSSNRSRVQRPARSGGVRLDGDHHHEETPHFLVPREQEQQGGAESPLAAVTAEQNRQEPPGPGLLIPAMVPAGVSSATRLTPPQRGPPSFLL